MQKNIIMYLNGPLHYNDGKHRKQITYKLIKSLYFDAMYSRLLANP